MTISRGLSSLALIVSLGTGLALAQQPEPQTSAPMQQQAPAPVERGHHRHNPERETRELTRKLNLTPDQAAQVEPILAAKRDQMITLRNSGTTDPATMHQQRHAIEKDTRQKLDGVLTPDQREQLRAMHAAHRQHQMQHGEPSAAPTT